MANEALLTFNQVLQLRGVEPREVRLLRHQTHDPRIRRKLFDLGVGGDPVFEEFQEIQGPRVMGYLRAARYLAGFVVDPLSKETVFVGLWERFEPRPPPPLERLTGRPPGARALAFRSERVERFDGFRGRLVVDWGAGTRAWVQRADKRDKRVLALRKEIADPTFPAKGLNRN